MAQLNQTLPLLLAAGIVSNAILFAQDDEESPNGLLATYTVGETSVRRVDTTLSFDWNHLPPDERLPEGPFTAEWTGNLLARMPAKHSFHAFVSGDVVITIDGNTVLQTSQQWGFASGEPVELSAGDHSIHVRYSPPAESDKSRSRLSVFWSSDQFTLEPIPSDVLYRDEPSPQRNAEARGRLLMDANRCSACHQSESDTLAGLPSMKAPALDRVAGSHTDPTLLIQRIWRPQQVVANSHMPHFNLTPADAENVAEFLQSLSKNAHDENPIKFKDGDVLAGRKLLNSLGCAACHQLPGQNQDLQPLAAPFDGPELANVAKRRSTGWLDRWLRSPETLNIDHRMPVFDLSGDERRQIVAALSQTGGKAISWTSAAQNVTKDERIAAGKQIVQEANCAACHRIPGMESRNFAPLVANSFSDEEQHCLSPGDVPNSRTQSGVRVPSFDRLVVAPGNQQTSDNAMTDGQAVKRYVTSRHAFSGLNLSDKGSILLQRNGCSACHDRGTARGLSSIANRLQNAHPDLAGQTQGLIPPPLTAIGDKLNDHYLQKAVAGEQKERRLPWLLVRMPKFAHSDADRSALMHHFVVQDRIPDEADHARQDVLAHVDLTGNTKATTEDLLLGNQLAGAGGFNCVACHKAGPFEPRNVALGTRGSDIMTMGDRIRPRFFQRWMKNPIRVVAGIEMPAIKKAIPDVMNGSLPAQIGLMWKALSDKRFTPPTVTSRFEQVVNVNPGEPPRIIRDVFTIGDGKDRQAVARAMAIGFNNGHNILIDLDTMQVRLWTMGEFARQRTEGKSWYWDMPGVLLAKSTQQSHVWSLHDVEGDSLNNEQSGLPPVEDEGRVCELLDYHSNDDSVTIRCASYFPVDQTVTTSEATDNNTSEPHFTDTRWNQFGKQLNRIEVTHVFRQGVHSGGFNSVSNTASDLEGWTHTISVSSVPRGYALRGTPGLPNDTGTSSRNEAGVPIVRSQERTVQVTPKSPAVHSSGVSVRVTSSKAVAAKPPVSATPDTITSLPGFTGTRLPIDTSIMPTSITWLADDRMAFTSLKGHVWTAKDSDGDGLPDDTRLVEEGLSAPFGILADPDGSIIVSHKPEIIRLRDTSGDGRTDTREVIASGWGFNDNYHDWTSGLIRDNEGNMYVGLGSDYSQKSRPQDQDRWRGGVIRIDPSGIVTPLGMSMRYPMGLAIDKDGHLFATDNQGVQNTFNEINHIQPGKHYGVPSAHQPTDNLQHVSPALMVPHPWTRSVNSILFLPEDYAVKELRGHGIGCEYDSRFLIRFTIQDVDGTLQGASYRFSLPDQEAGGSNFIGPICSAIGPDGGLYIGSIWDSGWQGGLNTGGIERLIPNDEGIPNGIRELTAMSSGFSVEFFQPVDTTAATNPASWSIQGYTRNWGGSYATPDSGRHTLHVQQVEVSDDGRRFLLLVKDLKPGYVYDISTAGTLAESEQLWPSEAHYSMKVVPSGNDR